MKLTAKQLETLALIAEGRVYTFNAGYGAWRISGANPVIVGKLMSRRLAFWSEPGPDRRRGCQLTMAGQNIMTAPKEVQL